MWGNVIISYYVLFDSFIFFIQAYTVDIVYTFKYITWNYKSDDWNSNQADGFYACGGYITGDSGTISVNMN